MKKKGQKGISCRRASIIQATAVLLYLRISMSPTFREGYAGVHSSPTGAEAFSIHQIDLKSIPFETKIDLRSIRFETRIDSKSIRFKSVPSLERAPRKLAGRNNVSWSSMDGPVDNRRPAHAVSDLTLLPRARTASPL